MSTTSENRRIEALTQKQQEMSGQDRYNARVAERDLGRLAKEADSGQIKDTAVRIQKEKERQEVDSRNGDEGRCLHC
jgi:hypothetical protein